MYLLYNILPFECFCETVVNAGDTVYGEVSYASDTGLFTVTITDQTTTKIFSTSQSDSSAQRSSAEWIAEAPSSSGRILPLANFGTVYYGFDYTTISSTNDATVNGFTGAIGSFESAVYEITMVTMSLTVKAQPSALTTDGTSFFATWEHQ